MANPGNLHIRPGFEVLVEMTDKGNIKLTDVVAERYIFINITDDELTAIAKKVFNLFGVKPIQMD